MLVNNIHIYKIVILGLLVPWYINAQVTKNIINAEPEIGIVEKPDTYIPGRISLLTENGDTAYFENLLGKPTVLSLVYYRCPGICTPLMDGLAEVVKKSDMTIGEDYQILTVSFNPKEGSVLAQRKKRNYINIVGKEETKNGWFFFTSDSANISKLTKSVGFKYKKTGNDYLHTGTLIFLAPDGKITRYLNGTRFLPFEFKMAVIEASKGTSGPTLNKVLQYCYAYDPEGQGYVLNITRVAGVIITFILLSIFISLVIHSLIKKMKINKLELKNE
ncbi:MAG: SCO family protein [Bacteroidales bacterium]|nr:SCO family protein [Bacteroidales bacterium]